MLNKPVFGLKVVPEKNQLLAVLNPSYLTLSISFFQPIPACRGALEENRWGVTHNSPPKALMAATLPTGCQTAEVILQWGHLCHYLRRRLEWCSEVDFNLLLAWVSLKQISVPPFIWEQNMKWISFPHPSLAWSWSSVPPVLAVLSTISISIHPVLGGQYDFIA